MENTVSNKKIFFKTGEKGKKRALLAVRYTVNILLGIIFISPLLFMFITSLNPIQALSSQTTSIMDFLPGKLVLSNFEMVFSRIPMARYLLNTLFYALSTAVLVLLCNSLAGYALAKIPFKGSKLLLSFMIIMLTIPFEGITLALYMVVSKLNLLNTPMAVIFPSVMSCFYVFMFRQFFLGIPNAVIEAAEIDGCAPFAIFFKIVIPMAVPVFITVFILEFFGKWSDYYWPMLTLTDKDMWNIQIAITDFNSRAGHYGQFMAALTICTLPIVILFMFLQKYYIEGIATQGIKDM